ncbi:MAG TPA: IclR family transcriptional regulator [Burkholderiales bacterium]|nr:IclR family transcriptional regulator [Burkholderiales bacterium]
MDVKTAGRVLDLYEAFSELQRSASLSDIARKLNIPVSSCFALLRTMENRGYLYSEKPRGGMYPTKRMFSLANRIAAHDPIGNRVAPALQELRDTTGETVLFAKRSGEQVVILDVLISPQRIRYTADTGELRPLYASSLGKAILSRMPLGERTALLDKIDMAKLTPATVTSRKKLEEEIARCAKRGWFVNAEESVKHIFAVAVPVAVNAETYAISLPGPTERMKPNLKHLVDGLEAARDRIEHGDER